MKGKKHKKMSGKGIYITVVSGIIILIALAFSGPEIVFQIQDTYQMGRTWQGTRNGLDVEALYSAYGSLRERLVAFAERQSEDYEFYVAGTEHQRSAELLDMLDVIVTQEGYEMMEAYGIVPQLEEVKNRGYTIDQVKKYVVYNDIAEDESNAVVVSAWYIEFTTRQGITIKLLVDTETYTLYYIQICQTDYFESKEGRQYWEELYHVDIFLYDEWMRYWFDYYEAGQTAVQTFEGYMQGYWMNVETNVWYEEKEGVVIEYKSQKAQPQKVTMKLPYGEHYLQWWASVSSTHEKGVPAVFSMGLKNIADLIPELQGD